MTAAGPRRTRPPWKLVGCLTGLVLLGAGGFLLATMFTITECNAPHEIRDTSSEQRVTLDRLHPTVEQRVVVHVSAAGLPVDLVAGSATISFDRRIVLERPPQGLGPSGRPTAPPSSTPPSPTAGDVQVAFFREASNTIQARVAPAVVAPTAQGVFQPESVALDCTAGQACDASYRVVLSLADPDSADSVSVIWSLVAKVAYAGWGGCESAPREAQITVDAEPAARGATGGLAIGELEERAEDGTIVARHLTLTTDAATDGGSYARLTMRPVTGRWMTWIRIVDDTGRATFDGPIARPYQNPKEATIDVPVLTDCPPGLACARGYWVIFQALPTEPLAFDLGWTAPPEFGRFSWSARVTSFSRAEAVPAPSTRLAIDRVPGDLGSAPFAGSVLTVVLLEPNVERVIDATIHVPGRPAATAGLDPYEAAFIVAHWQGHGVSVQARLEGSGTSPFGAGVNGGGTANLIAHPFDACPSTGSCDVVVRLVAKFTPSKSSSVGGDPSSTWKISLLGVPAAATVTLAPVVDLPRADAADDRLAVIMFAGIVAAAFVVLWRLQRRPRSTAV